MRTKNKLKAVGLISGGLDSTIASKIISDLGLEVHGVHFIMPWGAGKYSKVQETTKQIGIKYVPIQLDNDYLEMLKKPSCGYGSAFNPCIDCHAYMIKKAGEYMKKIGAAFVFTGEVMGQRPMSQIKDSLKAVEKRCGLKGKLLRPLSARFLDPTEPEKNGIIDREKLFGITGRSRREQIKLAKKLGIKDYPNPAGGCLLTDKNFGRRMKDLLALGYRDYKETAMLTIGRHFRFDNKVKIILGKTEKENDFLKKNAFPEDIIMELDNKLGPTAIIIGKKPTEKHLTAAAGFIQLFSKYKNSKNRVVEYWEKGNPDNIKQITAKSIKQEDAEKFSL